MESRQIGSLSVSVLGLGVGTINDANRETVEQIVHAALDSGITYFDISNRPASTERYLAQAIGNRDDVVIGTKFGSKPRPGVMADASPAYVRACIEESLKNLHTDRIDLFYLHRHDPSVAIAETLGALGELVQAGKVREVGCSKFTAEQLEQADHAGRNGTARFVAVENSCSLLDLTDEHTVHPLCEREAIAYVAFRPLCAGLLSGKYFRGKPMPEGTRFNPVTADGGVNLINEERSKKWTPLSSQWHRGELYDAIERLTAWAEERGHTLVELAFSWLAAHRALATMIAGASSVEQLKNNVAAASAWKLTPDEHREVTALVGPLTSDLVHDVRD